MNLYNLKENYNDLKELLEDLELFQIPDAEQKVDFMKKMLKEAKSRHEQDRIRCDLFVDEVDLKSLLQRKQAVEDEMNVLKARMDKLEKMPKAEEKTTYKDKKERRRAYYQKNREKILAAQKSPKNRARRIKTKRDYYYRNREKILARLKKIREGGQW